MDKSERGRASISIALRLANAEAIKEKCIAKHHCVLLLIYDADNKVALSIRLL